MRKSMAHLKDASRFLSTTVNNGNTCKRAPLLTIIPNHRRSILISTLRLMSSTTKKPHCSFNNRLTGSLDMFNLTGRLTLADLEDAIQSRNIDRAWPIFVTLASHSTEIIPFTLCSSLYSLLKYAKRINGTNDKISKIRQRQREHVLDYVQMQSSLDMFTPKNIPLSAHKQLARAIRKKDVKDAWLVFYRFHKDSKDHKLSRNMCLELMSLMWRDKQLTENQLKKRVELIALHGAGVSEFDSRYLSAADLTRLAYIHQGYHSNNKTRAYELIDEFVLGIRKKKKAYRADALDELVWRLLTLEDLPKAHQVLQQGVQHNIEINELVFVNLMNAYRRQRNYNESLKLFEQFLETGKKPTIRGFNAVLQVFSAQGSADRASYIFETMKKLNVVPDAATFTEMIRSNPSQCLHYYSLMVQNSVQPNEYTFSALIDASVRKNDIKAMLKWFQIMLTHDIQPNKIIISSILKSLSKLSSQYPSISEAVLQIAHQASMTGVKADTTLYTILLKMQTDIEGALKIQQDMFDNTVEPNTYTYSTLIDVCGKNKMPETAEQIFDLMKKSTKCLPNTVTYSVMIDAWLKAERKEKLESVILEFLQACKSDKTGRFWIDSRIRNRIIKKL